MRFIRCDRWGTILRDLLPSSAKQTRATDGTDTLELTLSGDDTVDKADRLLLVEDDGSLREYVVTSPQTTRSDGMPALSVVAQSSILELGLLFVKHFTAAAGTGVAGVVGALPSNGWTIVSPAGARLTSSVDVWHSTALSCLQAVCDAAGVEISTSYTADKQGLGVASRVVSLDTPDNMTPIMHEFRYGRDLLSAKRTIATDSVCSRVYAFGRRLSTTGATTYGDRLDLSSVNGGKPYVEDVDATDRWGIPGPGGARLPAETVVVDDECGDANVLLAQARAYLQTASTPQASYEVDVASLGFTPSVGERIRVVDETFTTPLVIEGRCMQVERDLLDPSQSRVTLGNLTGTLSSWQRSTEQKLNELLRNTGTWSSVARDVLTNSRDGQSLAGAYVVASAEPATITGAGVIGMRPSSASNAVFSVEADGVHCKASGWFQLSGVVLVDNPRNWAGSSTTGAVADTISIEWWVVKPDGGGAALGGDATTLTESTFKNGDSDAASISRDLPAVTTWLDAGDVVCLHARRTVASAPFTIDAPSLLRLFKTPGIA